jgi:hypothetical protein
MGAWVLGMSVLAACSGAEQASEQSPDVSTLVAALSVNSDGSDATWSDPADAEPAHVRGCGYELIASKVAQRAEESAADDSADAADDSATDEGGDTTDDASGDGAGEPRHRGDGRAAMLLRLYDSNSDGTLDDSELANLKADIEARCEARFAKLVAEFDTNGDGTLDASEWAAVDAALHARFEQHHQDRAKQLDTNGDGEISQDEIAAARAEAQQHRDGAEHAFDLDGDGELGSEEGKRFRDQGRQCVREDRPMMSDAGDPAETESEEHAGVPGGRQDDPVVPAPAGAVPGSDSDDGAADDTASSESSD